jgi:threonylcarbamoyladenosine tRNA methylthiotransferase CDKAL1
VRHIRDSLNTGTKIIWLTSQDTACYGFDIGSDITKLLEAILSLKRDFRLRLGMGNPDYLPPFIDKLNKIYHDKRMFKFLHVPVQSGSDAILKSMKRNYDVKTFVKIVEDIRAVHPDITIATDIIVGYPGETEKDFKASMDLLKFVKPDVINLARFWARPGTLAARKKQLQTKTIKERGIIVTKVSQQVSKESNEKWKGWQGEIIIDECGKDKSLVGRNYAYRPIILKGPYKLGDKVNVKITRTTINDLRASAAALKTVTIL